MINLDKIVNNNNEEHNKNGLIFRIILTEF